MKREQSTLTGWVRRDYHNVLMVVNRDCGSHEISRMCQVVLIRAGATIYDEQNRVQGVLDIPLSERGQGEVARMAQKLARSLDGSPLSALYCGPGENVIRTAEIVGKALAIRPKRIDEFRNLDQGLVARASDRRDQAAQYQAVPAVDRRPGDDLSAPGRDGRERDGTNQGGVPAVAQAPS